MISTKRGFLMGVCWVICASAEWGATTVTDNTEFEETSRARKHSVSFFVEGRLPENDDEQHPVKVLVNQAYAVGYSEDRKNPLWSAYHVDKVTAYDGNRRSGIEIRHDRPDPFYTDTRTASKVPGNKTFRGFHRGHMTPNNAIQREFGRLAQLETFLMSNICPQIAALNSGLWRSLEHKITSELVEKWDDLWVIAGPYFDAEPETVPETDVQVPAGFYMIILERYYRRGSGVNYDVIAIVFPNRRDPLQGRSLEEFVKDVDHIEGLTKLDFFTDLTGEDDIEAEPGDFQTWFGESVVCDPAGRGIPTDATRTSSRREWPTIAEPVQLAEKNRRTSRQISRYNGLDPEAWDV